VTEVKDMFAGYLSDARWQLYAEEWTPKLQGVRESQFALGNGYVGSRGILEENPTGAWPGTYFAGVYDHLGSQVPEMVNAPNPFDLRISIAGEKLDVAAMDVLDHWRILDMRRALIVRHTHYANATRKRVDYQSLRFLSLHRPEIGVMRVCVTPLDAAMTLTVVSRVNTSVLNKGVVTEGDKSHFHIIDVDTARGSHYLSVDTYAEKIRLAYASALEVSVGGGRARVEPRKTFEVHVRKGETLCVTVFVSMHTSRRVSVARIRPAAMAALQAARRRGFDALIEEHTTAWAKRWQAADVRIIGDMDAEQMLRFNLYHLMCMVNEHDHGYSPGARGLTGEGYRGHVFWDTELFLFPFYLHHFPRAARTMLLYRYHRLNQARRNAEEHGYRGAMFPWESADAGTETTPAWHKDLDGTIKHITTGSFEHHITADIAYAVNRYWEVTGDDAFMAKYGLELLVESARFWASRVTQEGAGNHYEILHVTGPDEFHENINNNAFTNVLAQWNLATAARVYRTWARTRPAVAKALAEKLDLKRGEVKQWRLVADALRVPGEEGVFEAFDGYFQLRQLELPPVNDFFLPTMPSMPARELSDTQFVKQADAVMLLFLFRGRFGHERLQQVFRYYEERTLHQSSLSAPIHATVAAWTGDMAKALRYLRASLQVDLKDVHGNAQQGIHVACAGAAWQAVIKGFAGVRVEPDRLLIDPHLPLEWSGLSFGVACRGGYVRILIDQTTVKVQWEPHAGGRNSLTVALRGGISVVRPRHTVELTYQAAARELPATPGPH
jgi:kojibiose phosphorylase